MEKAIAVVVSYNRRNLLIECISALRNQTRKLDAILVVNNGSTDQTEEWLKNQKDIFFITQANMGSGGGFNTGINWAFKNGYSWIWCMDDDGYPKENALAELLMHEPNHQSLLNCAVINKEDKSSFVWKTKKYKSIQEVHEPLIAGIGHPFNGTLVHRTIIEKVGVPHSSLFLWGDETEYYYRIVKKHGIPVYTVPSSIHYHPPTNFFYKNDWQFENSWKMYYYVRNRFHIQRAKHQVKIIALLHYTCFLAAMAGIILFFQKTDKMKKMVFLKWPAKDAINNNFRATPALILERLHKENERNYKNDFRHFMRSVWFSFARIFYVPRSARTAES